MKGVLPKHKQKCESLFQYKDSDEDSESVEDSPDEPPMKRMRPFPHWRERTDCKMMFESWNSQWLHQLNKHTIEAEKIKSASYLHCLCQCLFILCNPQNFPNDDVIILKIKIKGTHLALSLSALPTLTALFVLFMCSYCFFFFFLLFYVLFAALYVLFAVICSLLLFLCALTALFMCSSCSFRFSSRLKFFSPTMISVLSKTYYNKYSTVKKVPPKMRYYAV